MEEIEALAKRVQWLESIKEAHEAQLFAQTRLFTALIMSHPDKEAFQREWAAASSPAVTKGLLAATSEKPDVAAFRAVGRLHCLEVWQEHIRALLGLPPSQAD